MFQSTEYMSRLFNDILNSVDEYIDVKVNNVDDNDEKMISIYPSPCFDYVDDMKEESCIPCTTMKRHREQHDMEEEEEEEKEHAFIMYDINMDTSHHNHHHHHHQHHHRRRHHHHHPNKRSRSNECNMDDILHDAFNRIDIFDRDAPSIL